VVLFLKISSYTHIQQRVQVLPVINISRPQHDHHFPSP